MRILGRFRVGMAVVSMALAPLCLHATEANKLPLRGERLLDAMMKEEGPPTLLDLSVSPAGDLVFLASAEAAAGERHYVSMGHTKPKRWQFWLIDARSGRRVELQGLAKDISAYRITSLGHTTAIQHLGAITPQWSSDGKQLALLEQRASGLVLLIWDVTRPKTPSRINLPSLVEPARESGLQLRQWSWRSEEQQLLLEWADLPEDLDSIVKRTHESVAREDRLSWTWIHSQSKQGEALPGIWDYVEKEANRPTTRAVIDIQKGAVRILPTIGGQRPGRHIWAAETGGAGVVFSTTDIRKSFNRYQAAFQLWLLKQGDERARDIVDMKNTVVRLDVRRKELETLYVGGPGEIGSIVELPKGGYAIIEGHPDLATWPMFAAFGRLRLISSGGEVTDVRGEPLPLRGELFATDDHGKVFFWERWGGALFEVDLSSGSRTRLTPSGMTATSVSVSADRKTLAAVIEGVGKPPEAAVWSRQRSAWEMLARFGDGHRPLSGQGESTWFTWRSIDGRFDMDGILVKPPGFNPTTPVPLIVCLTGGNTFGTAMNENVFKDALELGWAAGCNHSVAEAGYMLFIPNHRQVSDKGFRENLAVIGNYGDQVKLDVEAGIDALIKKGWVAPDRIGLASNSHGGDELIYALANSNRYRAAIVDDMPEMLHELDTSLNHFRNRLGPFWPSGREFMTAIMGFDPVQRPWADVFAIRTPLLLRWSGLQRNSDLQDINMMGSNTILSMQTQTAKLSYALESNGVPLDVIVDRDGHGISTPKYRLEMHSRALQWFDYFILGKGANPIPAMESPLDYREEFEQKVTNPPGYAQEPHWSFVQREWQERKERDSQIKKQH